MGQTYSEEDDLNHIRWLCQAFVDLRYIRIGGKPLFLVYRATGLTNPKRTTDIWREEASRLGIGDLHLCLVESNFDDPIVEPARCGFDAAVEFQPRLRLMRQPLIQRAIQRFFPSAPNNRSHGYQELVTKSLADPLPPYTRYPGLPLWDNSARRKSRYFALKDSSPGLYEYWLREVIARAPINSDGDKIIFVNAWNEWSEGCHLEPCQTGVAVI